MQDYPPGDLGPFLAHLSGYDPDRSRPSASAAVARSYDEEPSTEGLFLLVCRVCGVEFRSDKRRQLTCSYGHAHELRRRRKRALASP